MVYSLQIFKIKLVYEFFVQQCSILENGSVLPHIDYKTNVRKFSSSINEAKIISIIRKLSPNKAHGCDNISIRMLKICDTRVFPSGGGLGGIPPYEPYVPPHKNGVPPY